MNVATPISRTAHGGGQSSRGLPPRKAHQNQPGSSRHGISHAAPLPFTTTNVNNLDTSLPRLGSYSISGGFTTCPVTPAPCNITLDSRILVPIPDEQASRRATQASSPDSDVPNPAPSSAPRLNPLSRLDDIRGGSSLPAAAGFQPPETLSADDKQPPSSFPNWKPGV